MHPSSLAHESCALTQDFHEVLDVMCNSWHFVCAPLRFYFTNKLHAIMQIQWTTKAQGGRQREWAENEEPGLLAQESERSLNLTLDVNRDSYE